MNMTAQEVVEYLNDKLHSFDFDGLPFEDNLMNHFIYSTTGLYESISFEVYVEDIRIKFDLWNSETDSREFNEEINEYEPLEDEILRLYDECIVKLLSIKEHIRNKK